MSIKLHVSGMITGGFSLAAVMQPVYEHKYLFVCKSNIDYLQQS